MIKCSTKFKSNQFNAFHPGRVRLRRVPQRNQSSILDKGSYERGFGAGFVYKNIVVDLKDEGGGGAAATTGRYCFDNSDEENPAGGSVGFDGLPEVGTWVEEGDALYS